MIIPPDNFLDIPDRGRRTLHNSKLLSACSKLINACLKKVEIKDNACSI